VLKFNIVFNYYDVYISKCKLTKGNEMHSTAKGLRFHTKELLDSVSRGEEVIITFRGKPYAKLVPIKEPKNNSEKSNELFGIWKNREDLADVNSYIRKIREGRFQ
jgi:prevent-host-death family protein